MANTSNAECTQCDQPYAPDTDCAPMHCGGAPCAECGYCETCDEWCDCITFVYPYETMPPYTLDYARNYGRAAKRPASGEPCPCACVRGACDGCNNGDYSACACEVGGSFGCDALYCSQAA